MEVVNERYFNLDNDIRGVWIFGDFSVGFRVEKNVYEIIILFGRIVVLLLGFLWCVIEKNLKNQLKRDEYGLVKMEIMY